MKKCILGTKVGMTQIFTEDGTAVPVTVVKAGPISVLQKKTEEIDGYSAIKIGYLEVSENRVNKPMMGQFEKVCVSPKKHLKEFKLEDCPKYEVGQEIKVEEIFEAGDSIDVSGISKGKGFQGTVKRYNTARGKETHGSHYHRGPGSMAGASDPSKVFKGKRLPGHMGMEKVTVQNLDVVKIDAERGLLLIKGAVPGPKGGLLIIRDSVKA